jgi:hypothetical protein
MDERLEKALKFSNYMVTLNNQKRVIKEQFHEDLLFFIGGCQFTITKELITFVGLLVDRGNDQNIVLTDDNDIPIQIAALSNFYDNILDRYFTASNSYFSKYEDLKKNRKIETLVSYEQQQ